MNCAIPPQAAAGPKPFGCLTLPARKRKYPNFLQEQEIYALLRATDRERDRLLVWLVMGTGLRCAELTGLFQDFVNRSLLVRCGKGGKQRTLPIPRRLVGPLRGWLAGRRTGYVFPGRKGGRLSSRAVQLLMRRLAAKAKLPNAGAPRRANPHKLRHHFACSLARTGTDLTTISGLMGHSHLSTTVNTYLHVDLSRAAEAVDRLFAD
jgi:integrase